jgi:hypothetical protein
MTDDEIRQWLSEHRHLSRRRKLAFVTKHVEIDEQAERMRMREEVKTLALRDGLIVSAGEGKVRATGQIAPVDTVGIARVIVQHWRQKREALERTAETGSPLDRAKAKWELAEMEGLIRSDGNGQPT